MAKTYACDAEGCDRKGFKSLQALAVHKARKHGPKAKTWGKATVKANKNRAKKKRAKVKPAAAVTAEPTPPTPPLPRLRFCPHCGYGDLAILEDAMQTMEAATR